MLTIDPLRDQDLHDTANLHREHLRLGLFPKLGRHFLGLYQQSFARSPYGIALVARTESEVIGALFATTSNADHYRWVVRHLGPRLAIAGTAAMITHPDAAATFARTRLGRYSRAIARHAGPGVKPATAEGSSISPSVLSHIVTSHKARRRGIGRKLIEAFRNQAVARGVHRTALVTEEGGLGTPFFERLGCRLVARRSGEDGTQLREYRLILDEEGAREDSQDDSTRHDTGYSVIHACPQPLGSPRATLLSPPIERH